MGVLKKNEPTLAIKDYMSFWALCMFDKFPLPFNFKSKLSCGFLKKKMNIN